ncbi:hypothetical protein [Helicobacter sp. 13S00477-4]|uniref:hypothetical protein n=1 Tax=Helicobacter sp. 13S00477-4 TaxID=1905759 RepID=UPI000BA7D70E|nr:hypothetical protein [Helicobacter sp. 13S00477-4]PAF52706.1 hypothetical protein BKH44_00545 [Helicobacter sp. 13S00477-4]
MKHKTILFKSDKIGEGDLGKIVTGGFIGAMTKIDILPKRMVFLNRGVLLTTQNSMIDNASILENLDTLQGLGVEILSCETCLEYFDLKDKVMVGRIANAVEILQDFLGNEGIISL